MHAEATSEKIAMGWHLAGKATAVVGTHTHVQTADEQILPGGTAYITDVGMTGPHDGIIGVEREPVINRFLTGLPARFEAAKGMPQAARGASSPPTRRPGEATAIERLSLTRAALEASCRLVRSDDAFAVRRRLRGRPPPSRAEPPDAAPRRRRTAPDAAGRQPPSRRRARSTPSAS